MIETVFNWALVVLVLGMAGYAHLRLAVHTATRRQALIARLLLVLVGLGFGWATTLWVPGPAPGPKTLAFFTAFGLVHVPAAVVLHIKRLRGVNR